MSRFWLMKSEPNDFSIDDLQKVKTALWTGVRNYQARNFMTKEMQPGDKVFFYHSNAEPAGIAGLAEVAGRAEADPTAFDKKSEYFDPKSKKDAPTWLCVTLKFSRKTSFLALDEIRKQKNLESMLLLKRGQRLSIQPVTDAEGDALLKLLKA